VDQVEIWNVILAGESSCPSGFKVQASIVIPTGIEISRGLAPRVVMNASTGATVVLCQKDNGTESIMVLVQRSGV
jgi:hypothetical protein